MIFLKKSLPKYMFSELLIYIFCYNFRVGGGGGVGGAWTSSTIEFDALKYTFILLYGDMHTDIIYNDAITWFSFKITFCYCLLAFLSYLLLGTTLCCRSSILWIIWNRFSEFTSCSIVYVITIFGHSFILAMFSMFIYKTQCLYTW